MTDATSALNTVVDTPAGPPAVKAGAAQAALAGTLGGKTPEELAAQAAKTPEQLAAEKKAADEAAAKTPEQLAAEKKAADDKKAADEAAKVISADKFKLPEGFKVDQPVMDGFVALAKEAGVNQEFAQKFLDMAISRETAASKALMDHYNTTREGWVAAAKADPEIGGSKHDEQVALGIKGIQAFGTPALVQALNETGMGDHPELIRAFARVGKAIGEDTLRVGAAGASSVPVPPEQRIFDHPTNK